MQPGDLDTTTTAEQRLDFTPVRGRHRFQRRLRRAERNGMPVGLTHHDATGQLLSEPLELLWAELAARRADWFRVRRRRFIIPGVVLHLLNFAILIISVTTPGSSSLLFASTQITVALAATWCAFLCGFGFPHVPVWVRSPLQFLSHRAPELLDTAQSMRHLTAISPMGHGWWSPAMPFTDEELLNALAGFVAIGGFDGTPATWIHTRAENNELEAFVLLGYEEWLSAASLTQPAREVYDQLLGEYDGTLGELVATSRSLAG